MKKMASACDDLIGRALIKLIAFACADNPFYKG